MDPRLTAFQANGDDLQPLLSVRHTADRSYLKGTQRTDGRTDKRLVGRHEMLSLDCTSAAAAAAGPDHSCMVGSSKVSVTHVSFGPEMHPYIKWPVLLLLTFSREHIITHMRTLRTHAPRIGEENDATDVEQ
jgi:hypothetical protein